ncbi:MAG: rhodanese-like domain-containing protein [Gemmatimonadota bacterium]
MRTLVFLSLIIPAAAGGAAAQDSYGNPPPQQQQQQQQQQQPPPGSANLDQLMAVERQDFGVAPTSELHTGAMHAPTPVSIPGGQVITTKGVVALLANQQVHSVVLDILGGAEILPGAQNATPASQAGSFSDQTQQQFGQFLEQITQGNKATPLVLYCLSSHCWMSYNASLRAINLGYTNVLWYRGGIEAWKAGGQNVQTR